VQLSITGEVGVEGILFLVVFRAVLEDMIAVYAMTTVFASGEGFIKE